jgi:outer membrane protein OmpA-like peptidoglycan-associated protein
MKARISLLTFILIGLLLSSPGRTFAQSAPCGDIAPSNVTFAPGSYTINTTAESLLNTLADKMRANPDCKVVVVGGAGGTKFDQQLSWDHVNSVIEYMSEHQNIDRARFIFNYEGVAPENQVICRGAYEGEEGPSNVAPPHMDLRR